jgi:signal peptidase I
VSERPTRLILFLAAVLIGMLGTLGLAVAASAIFGHKIVAIESTSMEPTLSEGDLVVAREVLPADIDPGELMTFSEPETGETITRRVRAIVETGDEVVFETKADALSGVERFSLPVDGQVAEPRRKIPLAGYLAELPPVAALLVVFAVVGLVVALGVAVNRRLRQQPRP